MCHPGDWCVTLGLSNFGGGGATISSPPPINAIVILNQINYQIVIIKFLDICHQVLDLYSESSSSSSAKKRAHAPTPSTSGSSGMLTMFHNKASIGKIKWVLQSLNIIYVRAPLL